MYWVIGQVPESYHATAAFCWSELGSLRRAIKHGEKHQDLMQTDYISVLLGYCYSRLGENDKAVASYPSIHDIFKDPYTALALAEAEFRSGNVDEARKIVATLAVGKDSHPYDFNLILEDLETELLRPSTGQRVTINGPH